MTQIPIVYHKAYSSFMMDSIAKIIPASISEFFPIDLARYSKISNALQMEGRKEYKFDKVTDEDLLLFHTKAYLQEVKTNKIVVGNALGISIPDQVPLWVVQQSIVKPIKHMVQGTIVASNLAMKYGWSINLGGGFHHAHESSGSGFCLFNDYGVATKKLRQNQPQLKILYIDLDAHHGDGVMSYAESDINFYIFDIYNGYMKQGKEKCKILKSDNSTQIILEPYTQSELYLKLLKENLPQEIERIKPDFIFYNGGSDIVDGDNVGCLSVSESGLVERDLFVFSQAKQRNIPISMCLSGGYGKKNSQYVIKSLLQVCEMMTMADETKSCPQC